MSRQSAGLRRGTIIEKSDTSPRGQPADADVSARSCGTCTLCCRLPEIEEFDKPANAWCGNCVAGIGCAIYADRPAVCRDFLCLWMTGTSLPEEWEPTQSHMMIYRQGPQITVLVDPEYSEAWKAEPYASALHIWARDAAEIGGYIIIFAGDDLFKVAT